MVWNRRFPLPHRHILVISNVVIPDFASLASELFPAHAVFSQYESMMVAAILHLSILVSNSVAFRRQAMMIPGAPGCDFQRRHYLFLALNQGEREHDQGQDCIVSMSLISTGNFTEGRARDEKARSPPM